MAWGRVDSQLAFHRKTLRAGNSAMGLWVRSLSWCIGQLSDGKITSEVIAALGGKQSDIDALVAAGLWHETFDGYEFHEWANWQTTRAEVEEKRAASAMRVAEWRAQKKQKSNNVRTSFVTSTETETETESKHAKKRAPKSRGTRLPDDFTVDAALVRYALEKAPAVNVEREIEKFRNHWGSASGQSAVKIDWRRAAQNWLLQAQQYAERDGWKPNTSASKDSVGKIDRWLAARGVDRETYNRRKNETGWLESLKEIKK